MTSHPVMSMLMLMIMMMMMMVMVMVMVMMMMMMVLMATMFYTRFFYTKTFVHAGVCTCFFFLNTYVSTHRHSQTQKKFPPQVRSKKIVILKQFVTKGSQWTHQFAHTSIFDHHGAFRTGRVTKHKF